MRRHYLFYRESAIFGIMYGHLQEELELEKVFLEAKLL